MDSTEYQRTHKIAAYQSGRANPFVIDCSLPSRTYCQDFPNGCTTSSTGDFLPHGRISVAPNPAKGGRIEITLKLEKSVQLSISVFSANGAELYGSGFDRYHEGSNSVVLNLSDTGLRFVKVSDRVGRSVTVRIHLKLFVV